MKEVVGDVFFLSTAANITVHKRPTITSVNSDLICSGRANLSVSARSILWCDSLTRKTLVFIGINFETPILTATTSYLAVGNFNCVSATRKEVIAEVGATILDFEVEKEIYILCTDICSITLK